MPAPKIATGQENKADGMDGDGRIMMGCDSTGPIVTTVGVGALLGVTPKAMANLFARSG
jgi:hypothetical protein